jgi:hypothetical protein
MIVNLGKASRLEKCKSGILILYHNFYNCINKNLTLIIFFFLRKSNNFATCN